MSNGGTHHPDKYGALEAIALAHGQQASTIDEHAKSAQILKDIADARSADKTRRLQGRQLAVTTLANAAPLLALVISVFTFTATLREQRQQSEKNATLQTEANEDAQWREALKSVSFKDDLSSEVGAFVMQGFFHSKRYGAQARTIACALATNIPNVNAFDEVITRVRDNTDETNFPDLGVVAQMLGFAQRARFHISGAASKENTPFLIEDVDEIDVDPKSTHDQNQQVKIAAWELDTASQILRQVWKRSEKPVSPVGKTLTGIVLENAKTSSQNFDDLDFSKADLSFAILYNARFKKARFNQAKLKDVYFREVVLDNADFSGVTVFDGSRWEGSNWWNAKCVPQGMLNYLLEVAPHPLTLDDKALLVSNCH